MDSLLPESGIAYRQYRIGTALQFNPDTSLQLDFGDPTRKIGNSEEIFLFGYSLEHTADLS